MWACSARHDVYDIRNLVTNILMLGIIGVVTFRLIQAISSNMSYMTYSLVGNMAKTAKTAEKQLPVSLSPSPGVDLPLLTHQGGVVVPTRQVTCLDSYTWLVICLS